MLVYFQKKESETWYKKTKITRDKQNCESSLTDL